MIHPLAEIIHEFIISKLLEDKAGYARSVGGLHFLLWKYCTNDDAATIDSDKGNFTPITEFYRLK